MAVFLCHSKLSIYPPVQNGTGPAEEEEWSVDTSEAAVKQRMEDLSSQATNLALTSDLEKSTQDRVNMLFEFVKVNICLYTCLSLSLIVNEDVQPTKV